MRIKLLRGSPIPSTNSRIANPSERVLNMLSASKALNNDVASPLESVDINKVRFSVVGYLVLFVNYTDLNPTDSYVPNRIAR